MLDDAKKVPSFSDEPQKFKDMTLFLSERYGLALHIPTDVDLVRQGEKLEDYAKHYLDYEARERTRFEPIARAYLRSINQFRARSGKPAYDAGQESDFLDRCCTELASIYAGNCEDSQDLSAEFCLAAKNLGEALQARVDAGVKRITIIQSSSRAEDFMKPRHG